MALTSTLTARFEGVDDILQGQPTTLRCPVYDAGFLVEPDSGTVTVFDANRTKVVDAQAVTITETVATYAVTSSADAEAGWQVEWTLVIDGSTHIFKNEAALVLQLLYPVLTDQDLFRRAPALNPAAPDTFWSDQTSNLESWRDEAWTEIKDRLVEQGVRPALTLSPTSFRRAHRSLTLALIFEYLGASLGDDEHRLTGEKHRADFESAWADLRFISDADEDGEPDGTERESAQPTTWLM